MTLSASQTEFLVSTFPFLVSWRKALNSIEEAVFSGQRRLKKLARRRGMFLSSKTETFPIGMLCVKNPTYADMAIRNVNSLHFFNEHYHCFIYCDEGMFDYLQQQKNAFDYPEAVSLIRQFEHLKKGWQRARIEALQQISEKGGALVDADSRWFSLPPFKRETLFFLAPGYFFRDNDAEAALLSAVLPKRNWEFMMHYASGYLFIPRKYISQELFQKIFEFQERLAKTIERKKMPARLLRLIDEVAINVVLQQHVPSASIQPLKQKDGPGDRTILLSYYYGCWNETN